MAIPKLEKIVINMGVGRATQDKAVLDAAVDSLGEDHRPEAACHQGQGLRLRLPPPRRQRHRLQGHAPRQADVRVPRPAVSIALPRIRDFRGVNPNSFDGHGNYTLGLAEQVVFPEIDADKLQHTQGMDITFVTSANSDDQARELLRAFGMPFRQPQAKGEPRADTPHNAPIDAHDDPFDPNRSRTFDRGASHVDQSPDDQVADAPQVRGAAPQPLQALRPSPRRLSQVRHLPDLLPDLALKGLIPGVQEGELVSHRVNREQAHRSSMSLRILPTACPPIRSPPRRRLPSAPMPRSSRGQARYPRRHDQARPAMMTDPIADMLTRIRNAVRIEKPVVDMPTSKIRRGIAQVLKDEGYIWGFEEIDTVPAKTLRLELKYGPNGERLITKIDRVSKPGCRRYCGYKDLSRPRRHGHPDPEHPQGCPQRPPGPRGQGRRRSPGADH